MTGRNNPAIGFGVVCLVIGLVLVWSGLTPLSQDRDADGYLLSDPLTIERPSSAVMTNDVGLLRGHHECAGEESFLLGIAAPDDVRMQGVASGSAALFMGIAPADAVEGYLADVAHAELTEWDCDVDDITSVEYTRHDGAADPEFPETARIWVTSTSGTGQQTLDWKIEDGEWAVVIMNADAGAGVSADVRFGARAPSGLDLLAWTSFAIGLVALVGGGLLLYFGFRGAGRDVAQRPDGAATGAPWAEPSREPVGPMS